MGATARRGDSVSRPTCPAPARRRHRAPPAAAAGALLALALAACGADDRATSSTGPQTQAPLTQPAAATTGAAEAGSSESSGQGSDAPSADPAELEAVVRAWSAALNAGDNEAAAALFARGALVIQGGISFRLPDAAAAARWNADLPCSGTITSIHVDEDVVIAVFALGHRVTSSCDAPPGTLAAAAFLIEGGKIAVWQQIPVPDEDSPEQTAAPRGLGGRLVR
jgi:hypothetical protein